MSEHLEKIRAPNGMDLLRISGDPNRPSILLLHGFGACAADLASLSSLYPHSTWLFPEGPLKIPLGAGTTGNAWFDVDILKLRKCIYENTLEQIEEAFPPEIESAYQTIEQLLSFLDIPRSRLVLGGFSQGGILAVETALRGPTPCKGVLIFSGTLIHGSVWKALAPRHAGTPFFQSHGTHDSVLPITKAQELAAMLIADGLRGQLHWFTGGHHIPRSVLTALPLFLQKICEEQPI